MFKAATYFFSLVLVSTTAIAQHYSPSTARGLITQKFKSPGGLVEECVVSKPLPGFPGADNEAWLNKEARLCSYNFYAANDSVIGVCPKLNSTNPGIDLYKIAKERKADFERRSCALQDIPESKISKFKQSVSCSYTPSIISYYQLGKALGSLNIPPAVIRTMDSKEHQRIRSQAQEILKARGQSGELIYKTWSGSWGSVYQSPRSSAGQRVFTSDLSQIYGAMSVNPSNELKYREVYGSWRRYDDRHIAIKSQAPYQNVMSRRDLQALVGTTPSAASVQTLVQMKDVADMLVIDYIFGQWDRPGNIHYQMKLYHSNDGVQWKSLAAENSALAGEHQSAKYKFQIKEMILKDNDCGIAKGNATKKFGLINEIAHISPKTYQLVQKLAQNWSTLRGHVQSEWLLSDSDFRVVGSDLQGLAQHLRSRCQAGRLKLDLDLSRHFSGQGPLPSCD